MEPEHYDLFVAECDIKSREYSVLKNAVVAQDPNAGESQRSIEILCDQEEARQLLDAASRVYPEAVPAIRRGIELAREL
jgi:hypothetical protein